MEVSYWRDFNHNYMVLEKNEVTGEEYMIRMMEQNHIEELLRLQVRKMNGKTYLYYEITSRQPVSQIYENRSLKSRDIEQILTGIRDGMNRTRQYLLNNEDILLDPEYIYMDVDTRRIQLCYVPYSGQENRHSFLRLSEFILKKLDHGEQRAVDLGYELFHQASKENFGFSEIMQLLLKEKKNRGTIAEKEDHFLLTETALDGKREKSGSGQSLKMERIQEKSQRESERKKIPGTEYSFLSDEKRNIREKGETDRKPAEQKAGRKAGRRTEGTTEGKAGRRTEGTTEGKAGRKTEGTAEGKAGRKTEKRAGKRTGKNRTEKKTTDASGKKGWLIVCLTAAAALLVFGAVVYFAGLDLTQTGGLAFLMLAVLWIGYRAMAGKQSGKKKKWIEDDYEEEDDFLAAILSEADAGMDEETENRIQADYGWQKCYRNDGIREEEYDTDAEEGEGLDGATRCLTAAERGKSFRLVSLETDKYGDIVLDKEKLLVGKKKEQVDIWMKDSSISRIHARLERNQEDCFVTDLNSMNGTYVGGERLMPNEKRRLSDGDKISFAARHYRIEMRDF